MNRTTQPSLKPAVRLQENTMPSTLQPSLTRHQPTGCASRPLRALRRHAIVSAVALLAAGAASAASYHVRTDGSDSSCNGSANAAASSAPNCAFQTIGKSVSTAAAGDTVNIQAGTFSGTTSFTKSGTAAAPITFKAAGSAVIRGNVFTSGNYIVLDGLTISPPSAGGYGAVTLSGQNNVLKNCLLTNYGASAGDQATAIIFENSGAYNTVEGCTIRDLNDIDAFHVNGHDQTIRNNVVTNLNQVNYALNHTDFIQTWGWAGSHSYNILVEGNLVTNSTAQLGNTETDGIADQRDWTFRNNVFANVGAALFSGLPGTRYYNNVFYKVGRAQGYALSLYTQLNYSSVGDEVVNNVFIDNGEDVHFQSASLSQMGRFSNNYYANADFSAKTNGEQLGSSAVNGGNPAFVSVSGFDFHPLSNSVLINRGADLSTLFTTDKDGNTRTGVWDIGAFEYGASSSGAITRPAAPLNLIVK